MSKQIVFEHDGKEYELEYTLRSAGNANEDGFILEQLGDKPAMMIPKLVYWAFNRHHKDVSRKKAEEIYEGIRQKNAFITALAEMYSDACNALVDDDDDEQQGNANWTLT